MIPDVHLTDLLPQTKLDVAVDTVASATAAGAIAAPFWWPALKEASEVAAALLPFLGLVLIVLQIIIHVRRIWRIKPEKHQ